MKIETIKKWKRLSATLKTIKKQEFDLRKEIAEKVLKGKTGTVNQKVSNFKLKAQQSERFKVDNEALLSIWSDLSEEEKETIKWSPEIKKREYDKIPLDRKKKLNSVLTKVPNAPTLSVTLIK